MKLKDIKFSEPDPNYWKGYSDGFNAALKEAVGKIKSKIQHGKDWAIDFKWNSDIEDGMNRAIAAIESLAKGE